jgi:peptidoglycan/xylan/chitin deacetylase (PgdA/CDA1 family)
MQWTYTPSRSPTAKVQRRVVQWRRACTAEVAPDRPVITFTFDDFPKSALNGADVLEKHGGRGGFYACTSMMGMRSPVMGEMFDGNTLAELAPPWPRDRRTFAHSSRLLTLAA